MKQINIHAAKTNLSALVEEAAQGKPFIIAKAGKPMVMVTQYNSRPEKPKRRIGFLKGKIRMPADIDKLMPQSEIIEMFYGKNK